MEDEEVGKNFIITKKIGSGAFGEIWKAVHKKTKKKYAAKFENANSKHQQLYLECKIYLWFHSEASVLA